MDFLKENWLWIAAPVVIVLGVVIYLIVTGDGNSSDFTYPLN